MKRKAVALIMAMGIIVIVSGFAIAAIHIMGSQASLGEHKIKRLKAQHTAQAGMVYGLNELQQRLETDPGFSGSLSIPQELDDMNRVDTIGINVTAPGYDFTDCRTVDITVEY